MRERNEIDDQIAAAARQARSDDDGRDERRPSLRELKAEDRQDREPGLS